MRIGVEAVDFFCKNTARTVARGVDNRRTRMVNPLVFINEPVVSDMLWRDPKLLVNTLSGSIDVTDTWGGVSTVLG